MTINITLAQQGARGTNYNAQLASYIDTFVSSGFPFFEEDDQMVIVGRNERQATKIFTLDGSGFEYDFASHTVSGRLDEVALGTLGGSYNADGSFDTDGQNHITGHSPAITWSGLGLVNPRGVRGEVHEIVAELMYLGGPDDRGAPTFLRVINREAHNVSGSAGGDTYTGTRFGDRVTANGGNDTISGAGGNDTVDGGDGNDILRGAANNDQLFGRAGNDRIGGDTGSDIVYGHIGDDFLDGADDADRVFGDEGNDRIFGGTGNDTLTGGTGKDVVTGGTQADIFVIRSAAESAGSTRDTFTDFRAEDVVDLRGVDANRSLAGNQAFALRSAFTGRAGELVLQVDASNTYAYGDTDGDRDADLSFVLGGYRTAAGNDFLL
jgi:Ca2+-binding RTX toxin-like protein